ncbi:MAG: hypothetical protein QXS48_01440 [Candidatus Aenigmatarchaeota archaeon]
MKGVLESHVQTLLWIVIGLAIILIFVFIAVFYMKIIPIKVEFV